MLSGVSVAGNMEPDAWAPVEQMPGLSLGRPGGIQGLMSRQVDCVLGWFCCVHFTLTRLLQILARGPGDGAVEGAPPGTQWARKLSRWTEVRERALNSNGSLQVSPSGPCNLEWFLLGQQL